MYTATCAPRFARQSEAAMNLYENDKEVLLEVELPGLKREDVSLEIQDRVLTLKGELKAGKREGYTRSWGGRAEGQFEKSFRLGDNLDDGGIKARFEDGLLLVSLPKAAKPESRKVEIA
jgi:HSP20 family protein